jgi:hypothetical protein
MWSNWPLHLHRLSAQFGGPREIQPQIAPQSLHRMTTAEYAREQRRLFLLSDEELQSETVVLIAQWRTIEAHVKRAQLLYRVMVCAFVWLWTMFAFVAAVDVGANWPLYRYGYPRWVDSALPFILPGIWSLVSWLLWRSPQPRAFLQFGSGFTDEVRRERDYRRDLALGSRNLAMGMEWTWRGHGRGTKGAGRSLRIVPTREPAPGAAPRRRATDTERPRSP